MKHIILVALCLSIAACAAASRHSSPPFIQGKTPPPITQSVKIDVALTPLDLATHPDFTQLYWDKAMNKAMHGMGTAFVSNARRFQGVISSQDTLASAQLLKTSGHVHTMRDPQTGDYHQQALCTASFVPETSLAGQITGLENNRDIASIHDKITVRLFSPQPVRTPAWCLIARHFDEHGTHFQKIIGWGKILQPLTQPLQAGQPPSGSLCVVKIKESSREVLQGDFIFLLKVSGTALQPDMLPSTAPVSETKGVVVEPTWEPEPKEPVETK